MKLRGLIAYALVGLSARFEWWAAKILRRR